LPDRRRFEVDAEHAQDVRTEQQPEQDEEDRGTDRRLVESVGDEGVARQEQDEQRDPGFRVGPPRRLSVPDRGDDVAYCDGRDPGPPGFLAMPGALAPQPGSGFKW
jgi:hypothetical protein